MLGQGHIAGEASVLPGDLEIRKVAEQGVRQLERFRKGLLREGMVGADPENLDIQLLEFGLAPAAMRKPTVSHMTFPQTIEIWCRSTLGIC